MKGLKAVLPDVTLTVTGRIKRPPMERTPAVVGLFERARPIGQTLGLDLKEGSTGGASDGNFTAALGVPTLDGLGCPGGGAHAIDEHILIDGLLERAALLAALLLGHEWLTFISGAVETVIAILFGIGLVVSGFLVARRR